MFGQSGDCFVCCVGLRVANALPALAIPIPDELRIARESFRRRQFCRIEIAPIAIFTPKCRDAALGRNARASENKDAHEIDNHYSAGETPAAPQARCLCYDYSQLIWRPLFCSSSQLISGWKYSIIARVEMSSPVASFSTFRQSSVPPFLRMLFSHAPTSYGGLELLQQYLRGIDLVSR